MKRIALLAAIASFGSACELWRTVPPTVSERFDVVLPGFARYRLPSGLTVLASRNTDGGLVHLELVMRAGYQFDPPGKEGLARMAANLLATSARLPSNDVRFGMLGATPHIAMDRTGIQIGIEVLQADAAAGVQALADFVHEPLPVAELIEESRAAARAELARAFGSPDALATIAIARLFAASRDHQSVLGLGSESSLATIGVADVEHALTQLRNTNDTALVVTGPHDVALAEEWATTAFARWPQTQIRQSSIETRVLPKGDRVVFVPSSDMPQTLIVVAGLRPRPGHVDAPAFDAAYEMLHSRVTHVLREDLQLSYGAHGLGGETDTFSLAIRVRADKTALALIEIRRAIDELEQLPSADVLDVRRVPASAALMDGAQDSGAMARLGREVFLHSLPVDALRHQMQALHTLDAYALDRSIEEHVDPKRVRIVVVGERASMGKLLDDVETWTPAQLLGG